MISVLRRIFWIPRDQSQATLLLAVRDRGKLDRQARRYPLVRPRGGGGGGGKRPRLGTKNPAVEAGLSAHEGRDPLMRKLEHAPMAYRFRRYAILTLFVLGDPSGSPFAS